LRRRIESCCSVRLWGTTHFSWFFEGRRDNCRGRRHPWAGHGWPSADFLPNFWCSRLSGQIRPNPAMENQNSAPWFEILLRCPWTIFLLPPSSSKRKEPTAKSPTPNEINAFAL
jgi:hypothetical protein